MQARPDQALRLAGEGPQGRHSQHSPLGAQGAASAEPAPELPSSRQQGEEVIDQVRPFHTTDPDFPG